MDTVVIIILLIILILLVILNNLSVTIGANGNNTGSQNGNSNGCNKTQFGCCPDGVNSKINFKGTNCPRYNPGPGYPPPPPPRVTRAAIHTSPNMNPPPPIRY